MWGDKKTISFEFCSFDKGENYQISIIHILRGSFYVSWVAHLLLLWPLKFLKRNFNEIFFLANFHDYEFRKAPKRLIERSKQF